MVELTEALIRARTRIEDLKDVKNLNVCGQGIADVSILQLIPNLEVLSLSANQISSLRHFAFCGQLKQLYLRANAVADLAELRYIMLLQDLRVLWLADNPCTKLPHYRAFAVAHLPNLENLDNVPVNDADRRAGKGMRMLQPATAADVLTEEREAAEQLKQALADRQAASTHQDSPSSTDQQAASASRPSSAQQQLPAMSPRSSNSAANVPTAPTGGAAAAAAAAASLPRKGSAPRPLTPPELLQQQQQQVDGTQGKACLSSGDQIRAGISCSLQGRCSTPSPGLSAPASACGSYRAMREPYADPSTQQLPRGCSVATWDLGIASTTGINVSAGQGEPVDPPRQLCAEHSYGSAAKHFLQQQQPQQQHHAKQHGPCAPGLPEMPYQHMPCSMHSLPLRQRQVPLQLPAQWRSPEHASHSIGAAAPASSRTNVLYAVMALLGELDVSGLSIVQREVQMRLLEQQQ